jgi:hypothetical protein
MAYLNLRDFLEDGAQGDDDDIDQLVLLGAVDARVGQPGKRAR